MPTRKGPRVGHGGWIWAPLQWGRVVADAEGRNRARNMPHCSKLQWGRVVADAEGIRPPSPTHPTPELQWGRVVADAEGSRMITESAPVIGFNGAASLPTRKAA